MTSPGARVLLGDYSRAWLGRAVKVLGGREGAILFELGLATADLILSELGLVTALRTWFYPRWVLPLRTRFYASWVLLPRT